jgi:hypothetical protein
MRGRILGRNWDKSLKSFFLLEFLHQEGFKYLFTMVDRSSRWLEATPLKSMAAEDCVEALISSG